MDIFPWLFAVCGLTALLAAVLPGALRRVPSSVPMVFLTAGIVVFGVFDNLFDPDPFEHGTVTMHLTEVCVIVALMGAGLALDIVPPADHAIGRWAIVLCLVGYCCGLLEEEADRSAIFPLFVAAAASAASVLGFVALGVLIDDPRASIQAVLRVLPTVVAYDVLLSPFVFYVVFRLHRRMEIGHVIHSGGRVR